MNTYPVFRSPDGTDYSCLFHACHPQSGWEWYGFELAETEDGVNIYFGYVMGDENEFGYFSDKEIADVGGHITTDPDDLREILPPIDWTKKDDEDAKENDQAEESKRVGGIQRIPPGSDRC